MASRTDAKLRSLAGPGASGLTRQAAAYGQVVAQLIESGRWEEMPSFEDMLPDERLPEAFFTYWSLPAPRGPEGGGRRRA
jgi:hypothetical protein